MSHHFDTPTGREDPRLNLCDLYLFEGPPGRTVMAMTVNPAAAPGTAAPFRDEGLYVFRFDTDGDAREDVSFKVRFGQIDHRQDENDGVQSLEVRRAAGQDAGHGDGGELLAEGCVSAVITGDRGIRVFAGVTADQFAGDATALESFEAALAAGKYTPEAFENHSDFFHPRNVAVIVVQVPTELIGVGLVHGWATVSLYGHAPEVQVARWGLPLITHLLIREPEMREDYNRSVPSGDNDRFTTHIAAVIRETTRLAGSAADPAAYAQRAVDKLGVMTLPYQLGTPASFDYAGFNGRGLDDDVMDVMLSLTTNSALGDGVAPDPARIRAEFPYFQAA
jgi:hypothetical protein